MTFREPTVPSFSCDIISVHGKLAGPMERFKVVFIVGAFALLIVFILALVLLCPQDCWSREIGHGSRQGTPLVHVLIILPFLVVSYGMMAWARSRKGQFIPGSELSVADGQLTVTLGDGRRKGLMLDTASQVGVGTWVVGGATAGPLILFTKGSDSIAVAADSPPLAKQGIAGKADVVVDIDDFRDLMRTVGKGQIE